MTIIIYSNEDSCWYLIYWSNNPIVPDKGCCHLFIKYAIPLLCMIFSVIVWCILKMCRFPCTGNGFIVDICHMEIFVSHQMVLVLAVWVCGCQCQDCPGNHEGGAVSAVFVEKKDSSARFFGRSDFAKSTPAPPSPPRYSTFKVILRCAATAANLVMCHGSKFVHCYGHFTEWNLTNLEKVLCSG